MLGLSGIKSNPKVLPGKTVGAIVIFNQSELLSDPPQLAEVISCTVPIPLALEKKVSSPHTVRALMQSFGNVCATTKLVVNNTKSDIKIFFINPFFYRTITNLHTLKLAIILQSLIILTFKLY